MFTPFAFVKQTSVAAAWTPASLTGIQYWWNTGYGINQTGSALASWTDQISGSVLTTNAGTAMVYTAADANVNNQPSVYQNGTYATVSNGGITNLSIAGTDDYSIIFIGKPEALGSAVYAIWGGETSTSAAASELAPYTSSPDGANVPGFYRFLYPAFAGVRTNTATTAGINVVFHAICYKNSTATITQYYNSTTANTTTTGAGSNIDRVPFRFEIGGYTNSLQFKGRIMEAIITKSVPTTQELTDLNTYVQNKYV